MKPLLLVALRAENQLLMNLSVRLSLCLFGGLMTFSIQAQTTQRYAVESNRPVTPGAYSFFKYVDNATDLYHGIPKVEIPIYTLQVGSKSFPIAFTYHAGGIRVTEEASWVGLGWDLALPTLVQTINDEDDLAVPTANNRAQRIRPDWPVNNSAVPEYPRRYTYGGGVFRDGDGWFTPWPAAVPPEPSTAPQPETRRYYKVCLDYYIPVKTNFNIKQAPMFESRVDSEPDVFKINLFGTVISFIKDFDTGQIKLLNNHIYRVTERINFWGLHDGWEVVDGDGYIYSFAEKQVHTTTISDVSAYGSSSSADEPSIAMWYLVRITSPQGQRAEFWYDSPFPRRTTVDLKQKYQRAILQNTSSQGGTALMAYGTAPYFNAGLFPNYIYPTRSLTHETKRYISEIHADNATVLFYGASRSDILNAQRLERVEVRQPWSKALLSSTLLKQMTLAHDYFVADASFPGAVTFPTTDANNQPTQDNSLRLRLLSLHESTTGRYRFAYHAQALPPRNSYAQDYWGYYNGAYSNAWLVPNAQRLRVGSGRIPDNGTNNSARMPYAQAGILTRISFPTGGSKTFIYELNTFRPPLDERPLPDYEDSLGNVVTKGNGLRVRRITTTAGADATPLVVEYTYRGGKAMLPTGYYRSISYIHAHTSNSSNTSTISFDSFQIDEVRANAQYSPALLGSGTGVGYSAVEEHHLSGGASDLASRHGMTTYYYSNYPDSNLISDNSGTIVGGALSTAISVALPAYQNADVRYRQNGLTDSIKVHNGNNKLIKRTSFRYETVLSSIHYGVKLFPGGYFWYIGLASGGGGGTQAYTVSRNFVGFYPIFDKQSQKTGETTTLFAEDGTRFVQKTRYGFDRKNRLHYKGNDNQQYTFDGRRIGFAPAVMYNYIYPDDQYGLYGTRRELSESDRLLIAANRLNEPVELYEDHATAAGTSSIGPRAYSYVKFFKPHATGAVLDRVRELATSPDASAARERTTVYDRHDALGRAQRVTRGADVPTTQLWHQQLPLLLAEVKNAGLGTVVYTSFELDAPGNCNWQSPIIAGGVTGTNCSRLSSGLSIPSQGPGTYQLSYWAKDVVPQLSIPAPATAYQLSIKQIAKRSDGWTQFMATVVMTGIGFAGLPINFDPSETGLVDEVRFHPLGTQMTSYTHGLWQQVTSQTDPSGRFTTYEYDAVGRLLRTRDEQGRILSQQQYHYAGQ